MKKIFKITGIILLILAAGIFGFTYIAYISWSPGEIEASTDPSALKYFQNSYVECRAAFRANGEKLKEKFDSVEVFALPVENRGNDDLTIDFCYIPGQSEKSKLLIISSGIHGIEGFTGSAIQNMLMDQFNNPEIFSGTGILIIHAMNPFGFRNMRRVTENNVDLNRNCDTDKALFSSENQGYSELKEFLNPQNKANPGSTGNKFFLLTAIEKLVQKSMKALRQAVLQGQYQYPDGLYFGGKDFEPQVKSVTPILIKYAAEYESVMNIDLHTGYGELGILHLFPNPVDNPDIKTEMERIFSGYAINWGDSDDFYTINGAFSDYIGALMPGKFFIPMTFEYGTLNSQTTLGSIHSIHNMILENQGFHYGYKNAAAEEKIGQTFRKMYYPSSEAWRSKVMNDTKKMMDQVFEKFNGL